MPEVMRTLGFRVWTIDEVFGDRPVPDVEWIRYADDHNLVVACKDDRIRRRPLEKRELFYSRLRVICLTNGHLRSAEQAACFERNIVAIKRQLRRDGPWVLGLHESGTQLLRIYPAD